MRVTGIDVLQLVFGGVAGAAAGSLIHSAATRLPAGLGPFGVPSCPECGTELPAVALLPGGPERCPNCGWQDTLRRRATELAAAVLTMLAIYGHGATPAGLAIAAFSLVLLLILRIDWQHHLIYTATIAPGLALALGFAALRSPSDLLSATLGALLAAGIFGLFFALGIVIYHRHALGAGDILLAGLIGAMTGLDHVFPAIFIGMLLAAVGGLLLVLLGLRSRRDYIPYGAYLCAGAMLILLLR
ncbi:MAG TPA: A24 family peptidase [Thermomicrobiaceae bacterium]|nr:A24 family peptidase [Thermomicrobiaceae bacterium]